MKTRTPLTLESQRTLIGRLVSGVPTDLAEDDAAYWIRHSDELHAGLRSLLHRSTATPTTDWIDKLLAAENRAHRAFFGQTFDLALYRQTLSRYGQAKVSEWRKLGLEVHFLPKIALTSEINLPGWKVKPSQWYWDNLAAGNLKRLGSDGQLVAVSKVTVTLEGIVALIDRRLKPSYQDGKQMFANDQDFMGKLIERLRTEGKIARYDSGPKSSRFSISANPEWQDQVRPALAELLGLDPGQIRLELAIEANTIPQIYKRMPRAKDGQTNTWIWYEEYFEDASCRLRGGVSGSGGLASVFWCDSGDHWGYGAVRPLGVLACLP